MPNLMRFINQDIVTGDISNSNSLNRYTYVEGNPATLIDPFGLCAEKYDKSDLDAWGADNFQLYLSVLGFYNGKNDYNLFSTETQKALSNFNKVYGLSDDQKLRNILSKIVAAYTTYNKVISSDKLKKLTETLVGDELAFKYDDIQKSNFAKVWAFLEVGYNLDVPKIAGVLGCMNLESRLSSDNANDKAYTNGKTTVHDTSYEREFIGYIERGEEPDKIAYGLIQWYSDDRKVDLYNTAKEMELSVSNINAQLALLRDEIEDRSKLWMEAVSAEDVALSFNSTLIGGESKKTKRKYAAEIYNTFND